MLGLTLNLAGYMTTPCREKNGTTHLAYIDVDALEEFVTHTNRTNPMPTSTLCIDDDANTLDVYWVNADAVPTCIFCVGRDR